jgi:hypothetical protein
LQKKTRSILSELDEFVGYRDKNMILESRANNIIAGAINLLSFIKENYDQETALDLERRLINSIRSGDTNKFTRGIRKANNESQ